MGEYAPAAAQRLTGKARVSAQRAGRGPPGRPWPRAASPAGSSSSRTAGAGGEPCGPHAPPCASRSGSPANAVPVRLPWKRRELHRPQQDLGDPAQGVERLVGPMAPAWRVVQVHVPKRPLEGVLLFLLAPMPQHQLGPVSTIWVSPVASQAAPIKARGARFGQRQMSDGQRRVARPGAQPEGPGPFFPRTALSPAHVTPATPRPAPPCPEKKRLPAGPTQIVLTGPS